VVDFVRGHAFMPRDFVIDAKGVCRLREMSRSPARDGTGISVRSVSS
jgi:hypothetical protein